MILTEWTPLSVMVIGLAWLGAFWFLFTDVAPAPEDDQ